MRILAIDTATEACSVSLGIGDRQLDRYVELERGHAEHLLPMVQELLAEGGVTLKSLDAIAFGRGPGGFTGVRLAASVVQGLAFGSGIGVVPVSDLAAIAERVWTDRPALERVLIVNDARMREVYWCAFRRDAIPVSLGPELVGPESTVEMPEPGASWLAAGRGLRAWPALADRCRAAGAEILPDLLPRAAEVLTLARHEVAAGRILKPADALPVYVRDNVAEVPS
ncbi:MAG: tRNA (adenosine(37)-N6)-threonylcarbamoyltransferase complex dimerization subunit type 1 TsaB [Steroidobacteraceae bacterium]|nr:tRNA (adenosine(37)-N6)-threonylcarbamoyltransferase complex dimerization subunit type 1 TsaB [Steroidobacteraceae bacterium]